MVVFIFPANPLVPPNTDGQTEQCCCVPEDERNCIDPKYIFDDTQCKCIYNTTLFPTVIP